MSKRISGITSKKFRAPSLIGNKNSGNEAGDEGKDSDSGLSENMKSKESVNRSMSDSQYDDLFCSVLGHTQLDAKRKLVNTPNRAKENNEEDEVAVPEPNTALSPAESAEEGPSEPTGTAVKTPDQRIDNSVLPPIKRKKPSSKIARIKMKIRPTKLNFDDPALMGEYDNLPKPKKSKSLSSKTSLIPKTSSKPSDCNDQQKPNKPDPKKKNCPKTPDMKVIQQKEFRTPIGRAIDDSQLSTGSIACGANLQTPNSQLLCSQSSSVQMQLLSPRSRLFRLQRKRNVGLWVQCTNNKCTKWRYLPSTRDPTEVPENWQCHMNHDKKYASCSAPEKGPTPVEEEDLIHNLYTAGSVVWGHLPGYPWWPAMVDDDPDVEQYYWITETCDIPTHYNVTFFDDKPVTRAWLTPSAIAKYSVPVRTKDILKTSARGTEYKRRIEVARRQAEEALKLPIDERLKKFSFPARYKGPIGKKRYPSDSEDDEVIEKSVKRAGKVPRKDKTASAESPMMDIMESLEVVKEVNEVLNELMSESESVNDGKLREGTLSTKNSGTVKSRKENFINVAREDTRKITMKKKELKEAKKGNKNKSETKQDEKDGEKAKHAVTDSLGLKKKKDKKVKGDERNNDRNTQDNGEIKIDKDKETSGEMTKDQEIKKGTKKNEKTSKVMNKDKGIEKDMKKSDETKKEKLKDKAVNEAKLKLKHTETDHKDGESTVTHLIKSSKKRQSSGEEKNGKEYSKPSSNSVADEDKTKKITHIKVQREGNSSEITKEDNHLDVPSPEDHQSRAEQDQSMSDEESVTMERKDESDISDAENSPDVVHEESDIEASDGENVDGTSTLLEETDDEHQTEISDSDGDDSVKDEPHPPPSPVLGESCGRSSADMFELQQCNPVLVGSQQSADFELEE